MSGVFVPPVETLQQLSVFRLYLFMPNKHDSVKNASSYVEICFVELLKP